MHLKVKAFRAGIGKGRTKGDGWKMTDERMMDREKVREK